MQLDEPHSLLRTLNINANWQARAAPEPETTTTPLTFVGAGPSVPPQLRRKYKVSPTSGFSLTL